MYKTILNILTFNKYYSNLYYILNDDIYLNMFFLHCSKYYICKNYLPDSQINESTRTVIT